VVAPLPAETGKRTWTVADVEAACETVEGSCFSFVKECNYCDYWVLNAFGAEMFEPGDYSKVTINTPEAAIALAGAQSIQERYGEPNPVGLDYDWYISVWFDEMRLGWTTNDQGWTIGRKEEGGRVYTAQLPSVDGSSVPAAVGPLSWVFFKRAGETPEQERERVLRALDFVRFVMQDEFARPMIGTRLAAHERTAALFADDENRAFQLAALEEAGIWDLGIGTPHQSAIWELFFATVWDPVIMGEATGEDAIAGLLAEFEAEANAILAE